MLRFLRTRKGHLDDLELLARYRNSGDQEWLVSLFDRYLEVVYGVCLKYLGDEGKAEDAVMAIFETLVTKTKEHEIREFSGWLYVLTKNHCLMQLRREKKNLTVSYEPALMHSLENLHPMDELPVNGQEQHLKWCLRDLQPQQKSCIKLFYFEGKSYKEIAEEKLLEVGQVRSYIQNGRRNLKICIEQRQAKTKEIE